MLNTTEPRGNMQNIHPGKFWSKVKKDANEKGCWIWQASFNNSGYGIIYEYVDGRGIPHLAHRYSFWLHNGYLTPGMVVMHACDVRLCVRPSHISEGTIADNNRDKEEKGRGGQGAGEGHNLAKLTINSVAEIRAFYATGEYSMVELGHVFNVDHSTIDKVVKNIYWYDPNYEPPIVDKRIFNASLLDQDKADWIRLRFMKGETNAVLARSFNISPAMVTAVVQNKRWIDPDYTPPEIKPASWRSSTLSIRDIQEIRAYAAQGIRSVDLAGAYHTSDGNITVIIQRKTWKDVPEFTPLELAQLPPLVAGNIEVKHPGLKGEAGTGAKLTWEQVRTLRTTYTTKPGQTETLAADYGLNKSTVLRIINNETWYDEHYTPPVFDKSELRSNMTRERVAELRNDAGRGMTQRKLAEKYGISLAQVSAAVNNKTFTDPDYVPPLRPNIANAIREWHKVGRSIEEMQERFNQTPQTLVAVIENRHSYDPKYVPPHKEDAA